MTEHEQMVEDCEAREERLSEWERGFVASVGERLALDKGLTDPMIDTLERIWDRVTG